MKIIAEILVTALYTIFVQNLVMCSGLGMSEAMRVSTRTGQFIRFAVMISGFSTVTSILCYLISTYTTVITSYAVRAAVYGGILALVYLIVAAFVSIITKDKELLGTLGISALNALVFAVPYYNYTAAYSFATTVASGVGAGFAFILAAALINTGTKAIEKNKHIPEVFRGTPALFLYVGVISLGFVGFTGTTLF